MLAKGGSRWALLEGVSSEVHTHNVHIASVSSSQQTWIGMVCYGLLWFIMVWYGMVRVLVGHYWKGVSSEVHTHNVHIASVSSPQQTSSLLCS